MARKVVHQHTADSTALFTAVGVTRGLIALGHRPCKGSEALQGAAASTKAMVARVNCGARCAFVGIARRCTHLERVLVMRLRL